MRFFRRSTDRYGKLGKGIKKNQKWRKPTGRDNKMREKRRGYPVVVSIGFRTPKTVRGKVKEKIPVMVFNVKELERLNNKENIAIIGKVGSKRKIELAKKAKDLGIEMANLKIKKILKEKKNEPSK